MSAWFLAAQFFLEVYMLVKRGRFGAKFLPKKYKTVGVIRLIKDGGILVSVDSKFSDFLQSFDTITIGSDIFYLVKSEDVEKFYSILLGCKFCSTYCDTCGCLTTIRISCADNCSCLGDGCYVCTLCLKNFELETVQIQN